MIYGTFMEGDTLNHTTRLVQERLTKADERRDAQKAQPYIANILRSGGGRVEITCESLIKYVMKEYDPNFTAQKLAIPCFAMFALIVAVRKRRPERSSLESSSSHTQKVSLLSREDVFFSVTYYIFSEQILPAIATGAQLQRS